MASEAFTLKCPRCTSTNMHKHDLDVPNCRIIQCHDCQWETPMFRTMDGAVQYVSEQWTTIMRRR